MENCDFSGWATKNDLQCSDGRTIRKDAFLHNDGQTVPLVWNHIHDDPLNVLGHAKLENRDEGVYAYCVFNETDAGKNAKLLVQHGDVSALSIYANQLKQQGLNVIHGAIREVSLVLAGANPGAFIDSIMQHGEESEEEAIIYTGEELSLTHTGVPDVEKKTPAKNEPETEETKTETLGDIFDTLSEKQKNMVYAMIAQVIDDGSAAHSESDGEVIEQTTAPTEEAIEHSETTEPVAELTTEPIVPEEDSKGGDTIMKHNVFDATEITNKEGTVLSHSDVQAVIADAKRCGSMRDSVLAHSITNIDYLFPDAQATEKVPGFITRTQTWVTDVMNGVHHTPFSRIKSIFADLTQDDARAKGYLKGNLKMEEVFSLLKRSTTPTTIYKKQKMDRDDIVDITDFDVVAWLKSEMRLMLDEEIARAVLVGDGRLASSDDKINETNIRPIWTDADLYTIKQHVEVATANAGNADLKAKAFIRAAVKSRKNYKGSGRPTMFTTEDVLTDCLLMEDTTGRVIYDTVEKLATALRVDKIVTSPVLEGLSRSVESVTHTLMAIIVNLNDYNVGADKGGAVNMFDDFDIDYNAQKYLIETRCSGALTVPYSAIALELVVTA